MLSTTLYYDGGRHAALHLAGYYINLAQNVINFLISGFSFYRCWRLRRRPANDDFMFYVRVVLFIKFGLLERNHIAA